MKPQYEVVELDSGRFGVTRAGRLVEDDGEVITFQTAEQAEDWIDREKYSGDRIVH